jgi:hypothetical protein
MVVGVGVGPELEAGTGMTTFIIILARWERSSEN